MPNNIELAIHDALEMASSGSPVNGTTTPTTPNIAHVLSAYIKVSGFADLNPSFTMADPNLVSSAAISDVGLISSFERALEKAASSKSPGASEASKLVARVRRQYWRGILIARGRKGDELTQLLMEAQRKEFGVELVPPPSTSSHCTLINDAGISNVQVPSSKKLKKKKKKGKSSTTVEAVDLADGIPSSTGIAIYETTATGAADAVEPCRPTSYSVTAFAALVSPGVKPFTCRGECDHGDDGLGCLRTVQRYVKGVGYKTYYPCPCCSSLMSAQDVMKLLDLNAEDEQVGDANEIEHGSIKKKPRSAVGKRKALVGADAQDGERKKTRQVKRRLNARAEPKSAIVDPYAPSSSRVSM